MIKTAGAAEHVVPAAERRGSAGVFKCQARGSSRCSPPAQPRREASEGAGSSAPHLAFEGTWAVAAHACQQDAQGRSQMQWRAGGSGSTNQLTDCCWADPFLSRSVRSLISSPPSAARVSSARWARAGGGQSSGQSSGTRRDRRFLEQLGEAASLCRPLHRTHPRCSGAHSCG